MMIAQVVLIVMVKEVVKLFTVAMMVIVLMKIGPMVMRMMAMTEEENRLVLVVVMLMLVVMTVAYDNSGVEMIMMMWERMSIEVLMVRMKTAVMVMVTIIVRVVSWMELNKMVKLILMLVVLLKHIECDKSW